MTSIRALLVALAVPALFAIGCTQPVGDESAQTNEAAQNAEARFDKVSLDAKIARLLPTLGGKVGGLLLDDGSIVRVPTRSADAAKLAVGDTVHVEAMKSKTATTLHRATVSKDGNVVFAAKAHSPNKHAHAGKARAAWKNLSAEEKQAKKDARAAKKAEWTKLSDSEKAAKKAEWKAKHPGAKTHGGKKHGKLASMTDVTTTSTVDAVIPGRHSKVRGVILSDGTVAYFPRHAKALEVTKGTSITVAGKGSEYAIGKAMLVRSIKLPSGVETQI